MYYFPVPGKMLQAPSILLLLLNTSINPEHNTWSNYLRTLKSNYQQLDCGRRPEIEVLSLGGKFLIFIFLLVKAQICKWASAQTGSQKGALNSGWRIRKGVLKWSEREVESSHSFSSHCCLLLQPMRPIGIQNSEAGERSPLISGTMAPQCGVYTHCLLSFFILPLPDSRHRHIKKNE